MSPEPVLDSIGLRFGTDKASHAHDYLRLYEQHFAPLRDAAVTVLEVGVFGGASLRMWETYFPKGTIVGVDINPAAKRFQRGRVAVEIADQANVEELTQIALKFGPFDIVIEDGSHMWEHQVTTLKTLFPFVRNGGFYVVEDLHTNYGTLEAAYRGSATESCMTYLKAWLDLRVGDDMLDIAAVEDPFLRTYGRSVDTVTFFRRACLLRKAYRPIIRELSGGVPIVAEPSGDGTPVPLLLMAHISNRGDVASVSGFINLGADKDTLQGIAIESGNLLDYRVRAPDGSWSDWGEKGQFVGTKGRSIILTGFTVRLTEAARATYSLRVFGRFVGLDQPVEAGDGTDCTAFDAALCGLQIHLEARNGQMAG